MCKKNHFTWIILENICRVCEVTESHLPFFLVVFFFHISLDSVLQERITFAEASESGKMSRMEQVPRRWSEPDNKTKSPFSLCSFTAALPPFHP